MKVLDRTPLGPGRGIARLVADGATFAVERVTFDRAASPPITVEPLYAGSYPLAAELFGLILREASCEAILRDIAGGAS